MPPKDHKSLTLREDLVERIKKEADELKMSPAEYLESALASIAGAQVPFEPKEELKRLFRLKCLKCGRVIEIFETGLETATEAFGTGHLAEQHFQDIVVLAKRVQVLETEE